MNWKFWKKVDKVLPSQDKFRIKVITQQNETKKFYPQFKDNDLTSEWMCLITTINNDIILVDVSNFNLIHSNYYHLASQEAAIARIEKYKLQLAIERANYYKSEEIIKV